MSVAGGFKKSHPSIIHVGRKGDVSVFGAHRLAGGIELALVIAGAGGGRHEAVVAQMLEGVETHHRFEHRHLDELAFAGAQLVNDRSENAIDRMQSRDFVGDRGRHEPGLRIAVCHRQQLGQAGGGLNDVVIGLQAGIRATLIEAGAVHIDDVRANPANRLIPQAGSLDGIGTDVVDEHIAHLDQAAHRLATGLALEIPVDGSFAAIQAHEDRAHARCGRRIADQSRGIAFSGFELDDFGAEIGEGLGAIRSEEHRGEIGDADSFEHGLACHGGSLRSGT